MYVVKMRTINKSDVDRHRYCDCDPDLEKVVKGGRGR